MAAAILAKIQHLVVFSEQAYLDDDGTEFSTVVGDKLEGPDDSRFLRIITPVWKSTDPNGLASRITSNTHVHLGIRNKDTIVIAFRGTDLLANWTSALNLQRLKGGLSNLYTDVCYSLTALLWGDAAVPGFEPGNSDVLVHEGFLLAFNSLLQPENRLRHCIDKLIMIIEDSGRAPKFEICGHSLGGALATLCAFWCRSRFPRCPITCVALGSPRVGNDVFRDRFESSNIDCYRLVNADDPIPTIPNNTTEQLPFRITPSNPQWHVAERRYRHAGKPIWLHVGQEICLGQGPQAIFDAELGVTLGNRPDIEVEEHETDGMQRPERGFLWSAISQGVGVARSAVNGVVGGVRFASKLPDHIPLKYVAAVGAILRAARQRDVLHTRKKDIQG